MAVRQLQAIFIHGTFEDIPVITKYEYRPYPGTKKIATRFTYGVALMELPFFGIAQLSRKIQGYSLLSSNGKRELNRVIDSCVKRA